MRSRDRGMTWEEASPDLTKAIDRDTLRIMGLEVDDETLSRHDGIRSYGNITTVAESRHSPDVLYVGTDDGNLQVTGDGGRSWTNAVERVPGLPPRTYVSRLEASRHVAGRLYATFDGHRNDDYAAYVYVSEDRGESWRPITNGLPAWSANVIREHLRNPNLLFLGNEIGVFVSVDRGESWARLRNNLPTVPVDDIAIHPRENDLVVGTHGRSIWILDDVAPLEEATTDLLAAEAHLFSIRPATMWSIGGGWPFHPAQFRGENPPYGALIRYHLRETVEAEPAMAADGDGPDEADRDGPDEADGDRPDEADEEGRLELEILDSNGEVVRRLEPVNEPGVQQVVWDFRLDPAFEGGGEGGGFFGGRGQGPRVPPGTYTARLGVGEASYTAEVEVRLDPRITVSGSDLQARQEARLSV